MKLLNKFISCIISAELSLLSLGGLRSASANGSFGVPLALGSSDIMNALLSYVRLLIFWPFAIIGIIFYVLSYFRLGRGFRSFSEKILMVASFFGILFFLIFPYLTSHALSVKDESIVEDLAWIMVAIFYAGFGFYLLLLVFIVRNKLTKRGLLSGKRIK